jgi:hypothetical protein
MEIFPTSDLTPDKIYIAGAKEPGFLHKHSIKYVLRGILYKMEG